MHRSRGRGRSPSERAADWAKGTTWEFAGDKVTISVPAEPPRSGTFRPTKVDGQKLTLAVTRPDEKTVDEASLTFTDDKTLRWDIGEGRQVVLVRAE